MTAQTSITRSLESGWRGRLRHACLLGCCLLHFGCAQSQSGTVVDPDPDPVDSLIWLDIPDDETTRVDLEGFELVEYAKVLPDELWGRHDGLAEPLVKLAEGKCLDVAIVHDLDGDGQAELVFRENGACSGRCCPSSWEVLSYRGGGRYARSKPLGESLRAPTLVERGSKTLLSVENLRSDPYRTFGTTEEYEWTGEEMALRATNHPSALATLAEASLSFAQDPPADSLVQLSYDLDADGRLDIAKGSYLPKWGRVYWSLELGNGTVVHDGPPFRRLGVLPTKTKGFHDLVVDADRVYAWNGKRYDVKED